MDFQLILYILLSLALSLGGTYTLIQNERTLGGFLFFLGSALVLTFYGLRWFSGDAFTESRYPTKTWPPIVNSCPDFLSIYERPVLGSSRKERVCVDLIGVAEGGIQKMTDPVNASNDNFVFKLYENLKGADRMKSLCQECRTKKVTWEGVYDGVACVASGAVPNSNGGKDTSDGKKC